MQAMTLSAISSACSAPAPWWIEAWTAIASVTAMAQIKKLMSTYFTAMTSRPWLTSLAMKGASQTTSSISNRNLSRMAVPT